MTDASDQFMISPHSADGHPADVSNLKNVRMVAGNFSQSKFDSWTSNANSIYNYDNFLKAVAKFPAFCDESNDPFGLDENETCKREIATLFAHMTIDSDGLNKIEDSSSAAPFHARGPMALTGDKDY